MRQKTLALLLALTMCLGLLTGCKQDAETPDTTPTPSDFTAMELDSAAAWAKHDVDDVVFTVDGSDVTWGEFFYFLNGMTGSVVNSYNVNQMAFDWDADVGEGTMSEYLWLQTVETCVQYHVMDAHLTALGVKLTAEDEAAMAKQHQDEVTQYAGEGATEADFDKVLEEMYMPRSVYEYVNRVSTLYSRAYDTVFGRHGELMSDEEIAGFVTDGGYITAKHILIKTIDETNAPLEGQDLAEKAARATLLLAQLEEVKSDQDALLALFDELMTEYSEDPGTQVYPDGYTFLPGEMVEEFQLGAEALEDYEVSGLVESDFGYHIILRLPTTRDSVVDYIDGVNDSTVGSYAAADAFGKLMESWISDADIQWAKAFDGVSAKDVFGT